MVNSQPSTLTYPADHAVLAEGEGSTAIPVLGLENKNKGGNPEYSSQKKQGAIANGVGENPLNRKGTPLT